MADRGVGQEDIGWRIALLREALGFRKATAFAAALNWTDQQLNNYERGRKRPAVQEATRLCNRFPGVTLDWIYRGERSGLSHDLAAAIQTELDRRQETAA